MCQVRSVAGCGLSESLGPATQWDEIGHFAAILRILEA